MISIYPIICDVPFLSLINFCEYKVGHFIDLNMFKCMNIFIILTFTLFY